MMKKKPLQEIFPDFNKWVHRERKEDNFVKYTFKKIEEGIKNAFNFGTNIVSKSIKQTNNNLLKIFNYANEFVEQFIDPIFSDTIHIDHDIYDTSEFHSLINDLRNNKLYTDEDWTLFFALSGRRLELILKKIANVDPNNHDIRLFKLLGILKEKKLLNNKELHVLHKFRKNRNDALHGRDLIIDRALLLQAAEIIEKLEIIAKNKDFL